MAYALRQVDAELCPKLGRFLGFPKSWVSNPKSLSPVPSGVGFNTERT